MSDSGKLAEYEYNKIPIKEDSDPCFKGVTEKEDTPQKYGYGIRHLQLIIFFLCLCVNVIGRSHTGVTIVAMTSRPEVNTSILNTSYIRNSNETSILADGSNVTVIGNLTDAPVDKMYITYNWPKSVQEMVLNAFFFGYLFMTSPMGMVCQRYGGKFPLQLSLFINGIVSIITPWLTIWGGWKALCCCRILQGLAQSGTYASIQALLGRWVPLNERATLSTYVYMGTTFGTVIAFQLAGFLGSSRWGWPAIFYAVGTICLICFILLTVFGAASPMDSKVISDEERNYIVGAANDADSKKIRTPWRAIFTSKPVWGVIIAQMGSALSIVFFFNQVPTYIHNILGINVKNSGILSSLPYVASIFSSPPIGWISDYCTNNNIVTLKTARRISNTIAMLGLAFPLICTSYTSNTTVAVTWLVIAMATHMAAHTGWMINHIDLAPNYSGTIMATGSTLTNVFTIMVPVLISYVVTDTTNVVQWRIMFYIIAGLCVVTNTIFLLLVSTDTQPWNYASFNESCGENPKEIITEEKEKHSLHSYK